MSLQQAFFGLLMSAIQNAAGGDVAQGTFTLEERQTSALTITHGVANPLLFIALNLTPDSGNGFWLRASVGTGSGKSANITITDTDGDLGMSVLIGGSTGATRTELGPNSATFNASSTYGLSPGTYCWLCWAAPEEEEEDEE